MGQKLAVSQVTYTKDWKLSERWTLMGLDRDGSKSTGGYFVHRAKSTPKQNQTATTGAWTTDLSLSGWVCYHYATVAADSLLEHECSKLGHGMINSTLIQKVRGLHTCPDCENVRVCGSSCDSLFFFWSTFSSMVKKTTSSLWPISVWPHLWNYSQPYTTVSGVILQIQSTVDIYQSFEVIH